MFSLLLFAFAFVMVLEIILLHLQKREGLITKLFKDNAFLLFEASFSFLYAVLGVLFFLFQFEQHPPLLDSYSDLILIMGAICAIIGSILGISAYLALGTRRSFCIRFFEKGWERRINKFPYSVLKHPMYAGGLLFLLGIALMTNSLYNLILLIETALLLVISAKIEGIPKVK